METQEHTEATSSGAITRERCSRTSVELCLVSSDSPGDFRFISAVCYQASAVLDNFAMIVKDSQSNAKVQSGEGGFIAVYVLYKALLLVCVFQRQVMVGYRPQPCV